MIYAIVCVCVWLIYCTASIMQYFIVYLVTYDLLLYHNRVSLRKELVFILLHTKKGGEEPGEGRKTIAVPNGIFIV